MNNINNISLSKDNLKIIAVILMVIDHITFGLLHHYMTVYYMDILPHTYAKLNTVYAIGRGVGRIAFPIFCFFIVEGFIRTRNVAKYTLRVFIFAIISEIPFDLGLYRKVIYADHQNVMFSLFIGLLMLAAMKYILEDCAYFSNTLKFITIVCLIAGFGEFASLTKVDYTYKGMLLIAALYLFRSIRPLQLLLGAAASSIEAYSPIAFVLLYFYNDETKSKLKYFFYIFYPAHLLIIYFIGSLLFR